MKTIYHKTITIGIVTALLLTLFTGCGSSKKNEDKAPAGADKTYVYCLSTGEDSLYPKEISLENLSNKKALRTLTDAMNSNESDRQSKRLMPEGVRIRKENLSSGGILTLDFPKTYQEMKPTREVLVRAGVVRTFLQLDDVVGVRFTIAGIDAKDGEGKALGTMTSDTFVENAKQINAYQHEKINLYFADSGNTHLKKETRSIYYSTNKPLEWAIVERLIAGPKSSGSNPTVPSSTQILSVTTTGSVCYVNLSKTFVSDSLGLREELPIYSIVDSLCDNCTNVKRVQFSIEGDTDVTFGQHMKLDHAYKEDRSLIASDTSSASPAASAP